MTMERKVAIRQVLGTEFQVTFNEPDEELVEYLKKCNSRQNQIFKDTWYVYFTRSQYNEFTELVKQKSGGSQKRWEAIFSQKELGRISKVEDYFNKILDFISGNDHFKIFSTPNMIAIGFYGSHNVPVVVEFGLSADKSHFVDCDIEADGSYIFIDGKDFPIVLLDGDENDKKIYFNVFFDTHTISLEVSSKNALDLNMKDYVRLI